MTDVTVTGAAEASSDATPAGLATCPGSIDFISTVDFVEPSGRAKVFFT